MHYQLRLSVAATLAAAAMLASCGKKEEAPAAPATGASVSAAPAAAGSGDVQVVKIASVAPMSGSQAHYGKDNANGVLMAVDDMNQKGMTLGGKKVRFEAVVEDDAADPSRAPPWHRSCATPRSPAWSVT